MSVILDALKSKKKIEEKPGRKTSHLIEEGLFLGKKSMVKPEMVNLKKLTKLIKPFLIVLTIFFIAVIGYFSYLKITPLISHYFQSNQSIQLVSNNQNSPEINHHSLDQKTNQNLNQNISHHHLDQPVELNSDQPSVEIINKLGDSTDSTQQEELTIFNAKRFFKEGNLNESLRIYQKMTELDPENYEIYNGIGMIYLKKELYSLAENYFAKALEKNQECAGCFNNLGYLKTRTENFTEAKKYLEKSIELNDQSFEAVFNLAVMYEKSGDYFKAIENYQKIINQFEDFPDSLKEKVIEKVNRLSGQ